MYILCTGTLLSLTVIFPFPEPTSSGSRPLEVTSPTATRSVYCPAGASFATEKVIRHKSPEPFMPLSERDSSVITPSSLSSATSQILPAFRPFSEEELYAKTEVS